MDVLRFNEAELSRALEALPGSRRTAFAAAAAERLLPAFASFARKARGREQDHAKLSEILDRLWADLQHDRQGRQQSQRDVDLCMSLIPDEDDDPWIPEQVYAEDAAAALAYALRSHLGAETQDAVWAARRAYESLDHFVVELERVDTNKPGAEDRVMSHPLVQAELARQQCDLKELSADGHSLDRVVSSVRQRAKAASDVFFVMGAR